ncbi:glycosyltransferase family A protein [Aestuariibacter salexigens]|uniref:glycosyltransferase family A protein n=1 Tax=Aestuariibacter salexigens TaxID=226010 RepID=UPI00047A6723|nr:glycosyltransferase family A protein [Aestuariibacter salexigens]
MKLEVIMPYYQREYGLLSKAVSSCIQHNLCDVIVNIIDDESPISAEEELSKHFSTLPSNIKLMRQTNTGVSGARNAALDSLDKDTDYVAFLDPDDSWTTSHIENIVFCYQHDVDLYFSDLFAYSSTQSHFDWAGVSDDMLELIHGSLYWFKKDLKELAARGRLPIVTSTVCVKKHIAEKLRFSTKFKQSNEDHWYWFQCISKSTKIAASTNKSEVQFNKEEQGLFSSIKNNWRKTLQSIHDQTTLHTNMKKMLIKNSDADILNNATLRELRRSFCRAILWHLIEEHSFPSNAITRFNNDFGSIKGELVLQMVIMLKNKAMKLSKP